MANETPAPLELTDFVGMEGEPILTYLTLKRGQVLPVPDRGQKFSGRKTPKERMLSVEGRQHTDKTGSKSRSEGRKAHYMPAALLYASVCSAGK